MLYYLSDDDDEAEDLSKRKTTYDTLPRAQSEVSLREASRTPPPSDDPPEPPSRQRRSSLTSVREENEPAESPTPKSKVLE